MKPYYERGGITILHGDCREIALDITADAIIADPPYGIRWRADGLTRGRGKLAKARDFPDVHGDQEPFDPSFWLSYRQVILFGANHFAHRLPPSAAWLVWDKRDGMPKNDLSDCELAWTNLKGPARLFSHRWNGMLRDSEKGLGFHATQKPVALMRWIVAMTSGTILDPFAGAGPTLVAAKLENRRAIGIEIEERYCEVAAKRLAQEVFDFNQP